MSLGARRGSFWQTGCCRICLAGAKSYILNKKSTKSLGKTKSVEKNIFLGKVSVY